MQLYLIRHPQPQDVAGLCYGRQEVRVDADSLARAVAAVRAQLTGAELDRARIFSSPSLRCRLLAGALAAPRAPAIAGELVEMDFGTWEGRRWDGVPRDELDAWAEDVWNYRPGGAESAALMADRWLRWSSRLARGGGGTAIAVTHAGMIRVAQRCSGAMTAEAFARAVIDYGSVHRVEVEDLSELEDLGVPG